MIETPLIRIDRHDSGVVEVVLDRHPLDRDGDLILDRDQQAPGFRVHAPVGIGEAQADHPQRRALRRQRNEHPPRRGQGVGVAPGVAGGTGNACGPGAGSSGVAAGRRGGERPVGDGRGQRRRGSRSGLGNEGGRSRRGRGLLGLRLGSGRSGRLGLLDVLGVVGRRRGRLRLLTHA